MGPFFAAIGLFLVWGARGGVWGCGGVRTCFANEHTSERTSEQTHKRTSERTSERPNEGTNEERNERRKERTNEGTNEQTNEQTNGRAEQNKKMHQNTACENCLPWDSMCLGCRLPTHTSVPSRSSANLHQSLAGSTVDRCDRPKPHRRAKLPSEVRWIAVTVRNSTKSW